MGDRFTLDLKCAWCNKLNEDVYYAESSGVTTFLCDECLQESEIVVQFVSKKGV
jgi:hypothetical protein